MLEYQQDYPNLSQANPKAFDRLVETVCASLDEDTFISEDIILARNSLKKFILYHNAQFMVNWHHDVMFDYIERFIAGDIRYLMFLLPPRHTKSEIVSRYLPAYLFGKNPDIKIMGITYGASLSRDMNRDVQEIMLSDRYRSVFPYTRLGSQGKNDNYSIRTADAFTISGKKGSYRNAGVGGALTGKGFNVGIIDDVIKNSEEAISQIYRDKTWRYITTAFLSRQQKFFDGREPQVIVVGTHWNLDDYLARFQKEFGKECEVVKLPAIAEEPIAEYDRRSEGEALWPEWTSKKELLKRKSWSAYEFASLYQQNPTGADGSIFKNKWIKVKDTFPRPAEFILYVDKAGTEGGGAYTAMVLMARASDSAYYIVDVIRGQWAYAEREKILLSQAIIYGRLYGKDNIEIVVEQEPGSGGVESADRTMKMLSGFTRSTDRPIGDKDTRLNPISAEFRSENVYLIEGDWNIDFIDELLSVPRGKYRDQTDAMAGAFKILVDRMEDEIGVYIL